MNKGDRRRYRQGAPARAGVTDVRPAGARARTRAVSAAFRIGSAWRRESPGALAAALAGTGADRQDIEPRIIRLKGAGMTDREAAYPHSRFLRANGGQLRLECRSGRNADRLWADGLSSAKITRDGQRPVAHGDHQEGASAEASAPRDTGGGGTYPLKRKNARSSSPVARLARRSSPWSRCEPIPPPAGRWVTSAIGTNAAISMAI